ncbi:extensin-like domain-containing protein [Jannaschia marina]|uniref:extensin-like domain-containing protein n=1 Tax=Jannaschia marina TaxID=2741674 RepID=UPI001F256C66|nr:extensin family protein [Jannaschia marina]
MRYLAAALIAALAVPAMAEMRPTPRPTLEVEVMSTRGTTEVPEITAIPRSVRPVERRTMEERLAQMVAAAIRTPEPRIDAGGSIRRSGRPSLRPADLILAASRTPRRQAGTGICGPGSIQATRIEPVRGAGGCGIPDAVRVTAVSGVALSRPTRMNCATAVALDNWVRQGVVPTVGRTGGGVVALQVAAGYSCRTRNNQSGARLSEHAKGNAIDISAITLANGEQLSVLNDWGRGSKGRLLRTLWQRACGPFGTVLGPESDRFHRDHFHFDVAAYRSGPYCR